MPWRWRCGAGRSRTRGRRPRTARPRLEVQLWQRQRRRCDRQRPGRTLDAESDQMGQWLFRHAVRLRVGTDEEPRRSTAVEGEERGRQGSRAGRERSVEAGSDNDDHRGHGDADGPDLRADFPPVPQEPRSVRGRVRPRVVQADPPRHGPAFALSRPGGSHRGTAVAGPRPRSRSQADRRAGHCCAQGQDPRLGPLDLPIGLYRLGLGGDLPRL